MTTADAFYDLQRLQNEIQLELERLTLGTDGRLFIEHYDPKEDFPDKKAAHIGIGTRQK